MTNHLAVPEWAVSMIRNYRAMYKNYYGQNTTLDDDQIWWICNNVFDDTDKALEDKARVETMRAEELVS